MGHRWAAGKAGGPASRHPSQVAREHGIQGGNAGQIVKEFALSKNINLSTPKRKSIKRPCKIKLPGTDISIPSNPPVNTVKSDIHDMVASGRFSVGEECAPYKITKYVVKDDRKPWCKPGKCP